MYILYESWNRVVGMVIGCGLEFYTAVCT